MNNGFGRIIYTADEEWLSTLKTILEHGQDVRPRGIATREIIGHKSVVDMNFPIVTNPGRVANYRFMVGEAWWILSGHDDVESIAPFNSRIAQYSDNGATFFGAYGPKFVNQVSYVVYTLSRDLDSRQAVINIWREAPPQTKDVPCTLSVQFLIRNGLIHCNVSMRSSDIWLGWIYDVFNFSMMAKFVAAELWHIHRLQLGLGYLTLTAGSQHLYETDRTRAEAVLKAGDVQPWLLGSLLDSAHSGNNLVYRLEELTKLPSNQIILETLLSQELKIDETTS